MKALFFAILTVLSLFTAPLQASTDATNDRTMSISASPLSLLFGHINLLYQYKLFDYLALTIPGKFNYNYGAARLVEALSDKKNVEIVGAPFETAIGVGVRFLLNKKGLNDTFYVEPRVFLGYQQLGIKADGEIFEVKTMKIQPMFNFGWDWYWNHGMYVGLGFGFGYTWHINQKLTIPKALEKFKNDAGVGFFIPVTSGTFALDGEFKLGYSW
jgi:hypothetical protein